jgi:hypothetical protein
MDSELEGATLGEIDDVFRWITCLEDRTRDDPEIYRMVQPATIAVKHLRIETVSQGGRGHPPLGPSSSAALHRWVVSRFRDDCCLAHIFLRLAITHG